MGGNDNEKNKNLLKEKTHFVKAPNRVIGQFLLESKNIIKTNAVKRAQNKGLTRKL